MIDLCVPLAGKKALVTGAAKGIGRGVALALAEAGADVCVHYRTDPEAAETLAGEIDGLGRRAWTFRADLGRDDELEALFAAVDKAWNGLDIAVNNAGWDPGAMPLASIDAAGYRRLTDINVKGTLFCCLREIELMRRNPDGGSIVNIGSVHQDTSVPGRTLYALSKGAIHAMTGQLALECGGWNIRINNLAPGYIAVERLVNAAGFDPEAVADDIPVRRVGRPEDVGAFAVFLASPASGFVTGQTLVVDGGLSRKLARSGMTLPASKGVPSFRGEKPRRLQHV